MPRRPLRHSMRNRSGHQEVPSSSGTARDSYEPAELTDDDEKPDVTIGMGDDEAIPVSDLPPGGFEIEEELGRGGYGLVQAAIQRTFHRPVAIKTLLAKHQNGPQRRNFIAEAVVTAYLQHPNIVPIYDLHETYGELQLIMKRVQGHTWEELLHPRSDNQRAEAMKYKLADHLDILAKVIDAVAYAHDQGILHRDIKPHNVMIGDYGEVLLMDWGCAVTFGGRQLPGVKHVSEIQRVTGTPAYMAPEMARCETHLIGPHSDVYLLGGLLYEILTDHRPHEAKRSKEAVRKAAKGKVVPPKERAPNRTMSDELAGLARYALRAKVDRRLPTAKEFGARLKLYDKHREAEQLVRQAQTFMRKARDGRDAMEHCARAITLNEQALAIWERCTPAKASIIEAALTYARLAIDQGSYQVALNQAKLAVHWAEERESADDIREADELVRRAEQSIAEQEERQAHLRRLRKMTKTLSLTLIIVMTGATLFSCYSLWSMWTEKAAREETQRLAAPAWATRAKDQLAAGNLVEAKEFAELALQFNPDLPDNHLLLAQLHIIDEDKPAALASLAAYTDAGGSLQTDKLGKLLSATPGEDEAQHQDQIAVALQELGLHLAAQRFYSSQSGQLVGYRARLDKILEGKWSLTMGQGQELSLSCQSGLPNLRPLKGIPINHLTIGRTKELKTLDGVQDLPLQSLSIASSSITDLAPLMNTKLERLEVHYTAIANIAPIRHVPIKQLTVVGDRNLSDFSAVQDMPALARLVLRNNSRKAIFDASWLAGKQITELNLYGFDELPNAAMLADLPLQRLALHRTRPHSLNWLEGTSLTSLSLSECGNLLADANCLPIQTLRSIGLSGMAIPPLDPLAGGPLQQFTAHRATNEFTIAPLANCAELKRLRVDCHPSTKGLPELRQLAPTFLDSENHEIGQFWPAFDLIVELTGSGEASSMRRCRFDRGKLIELDLSSLTIPDVAFLAQYPNCSTLNFTKATCDLANLPNRRSWNRLFFDQANVTNFGKLSGASVYHISFLGAEIDDWSALKTLKNTSRSSPWIDLINGKISYEAYTQKLDRKRRGWQPHHLYQVIALKLRGQEAEAKAFLEPIRQSRGNVAATAEIIKQRFGW